MSLKASQLQNIQHFVVVMLENRSFDHMLGFLYRERGNVSPLGHPFEGLTGNESNPDDNGNPVQVFPIQRSAPYAYFMPGADPGEGYMATNSQLFGSTQAPPDGTVPSMQGFVKDYSYTLGWESQEGWSILSGTQASSIMGIFPPEMLPVLSGLARGYAVCDEWFCSAPTETLPNRAFALMATSQGRLTDKDKVYTAKSIFALLEEAGKSWAVYGYDAPPLTRNTVTDITHADDSCFGEFSDFQAAAKQGTLANFIFLEPSWGTDGNSQHPNYDVAKGEQFLLDVYNTLRASPSWNETLLVITYDEHGGCYDHVPPPANAVPPDDSAGQYGFDFKRFGPRVPTVLVSPLIEAGTVFRAPAPKEGGTATPFDHTSILTTVEARFGLPALTKRDAAAPHLGGVFTLSKPRTDDPLSGVTAPVSSEGQIHADTPTHLQHVLAETASDLPVHDEKHGYHHTPPSFRTGAEANAYVRERMRRLQKRPVRRHAQPHKSAGPRKSH
ncbi:MAG: hypothetical protein JXB05_36790 [Myxococcaceae bacterium]|nr:hypothetical protein [Myxococcaceae bacterium]